MTIVCDRCKKKNKQRYRTFYLKTSDNTEELVTWCYDCIDSPTPGSIMTKEKAAEHLATPFWKLMGLKPKPHEIAREKEMHRRGMTYLDLQRSREAGRAVHPSAMPEVQKQWEGGNNNAIEYEKSS